MNITTLKKAYILLVCLFALNYSCKNDKDYTAVSQNEKAIPLALLENHYKTKLSQCINALEALENATSFETALSNYKDARNHFKSIEPILAFVDKNNYMSLNAPNILKVEEEDATDIKIKTPFGFQVIEEKLHDEPLDLKSVAKITKKTKNRLQLIEQNTYVKLKDYHVIWLIRDQIARIALTGITGFDSPVLEASLTEAQLGYATVKNILNTYTENFSDPALLKKWNTEIKASIKALQTDFNNFDRYLFIKNHTHKQLALLNNTVKDWNVEFPFELAFNNTMTSLFSNNTFNIDFFADYVEIDSLKHNKQQLGKTLFNDRKLSANNAMSCATCHKQELAFTDGLKIFPKQKRNTPTLTYAALQQSFFYDGRTGNLEGQIVDVVNNVNEFHSDLSNLQTVIKTDSTYVKFFNKLYPNGVTDANIRNAIAVYIRSLNTFNSKFDNNINDIEQTISQSEINGFNLFMGKAKCATCHFAPVFNGTVPPNFTETEFELLGVPKSTNLPAIADTDFGRYDVFKTEERKHFFKTPTVRNISKTAPYMHNGVYADLEALMDFYNNGGGAGLGLEFEYQTLPPDSLNLQPNEIKDIIAFMNSLEDKQPIL
ncbi:methylamine utilization protein [Winogradskyella sp. J14-2]|uniref:cytochrome-c peroxidase n=1 Tax=Winogradskyella sp. J14-2 TaxID=1936080 RepID=UPI000972C16C|nr:cytochrome c peroxidase [Winogradskyella sp. J14-2]APY07979.1 methylamine utilization protein [Winogradskyella sp. J14-2]